MASQLISPDIVGREIEPDEQQVDLRWLMAYSAGLGATGYPHALFPVCYEWPATRKLREQAGLAPIDARLVHAQHDLTIHRPPREEALTISGKVVAVQQKKPGTLVVFRFETHGEGGDKVSTTDFTALYRGVKLDGADRSSVALEPPPPAARALEPAGEIEVAATAAHVYTECARIWNPIHTDRAYARAAGLPDIILHGTATLALSISALKRPVRRVRCRFTGMVLMPSRLRVFASGDGAFETRNEQGATVIERGWIS